MDPVDMICMPFVYRNFDTPSYDRKLALDRIRTKATRGKKRCLRMKKLNVYRCEIQRFLGEGMLSYGYYYADIIAESGAEARRIAVQNSECFKCCKIESSQPADENAEKGIKWL